MHAVASLTQFGLFLTAVIFCIRFTAGMPEGEIARLVGGHSLSRLRNDRALEVWCGSPPLYYLISLTEGTLVSSFHPSLGSTFQILECLISASQALEFLNPWTSDSTYYLLSTGA